jgi:hypothetical protein
MASSSVRKALKNVTSGNKPRRLHPPNTEDTLEPVSFPNAIPKQYPPLVLIHLIILSSALVLLPTTPIPNLPLPPPPRGLDKPQHPFLNPITARPLLTLAWACLGVVMLIPWWAGSLRRWAHDGTLGSRAVQMRLAGDPHKRRVRPVLPPHTCCDLTDVCRTSGMLTSSLRMLLWHCTPLLFYSERHSFSESTNATNLLPLIIPSSPHSPSQVCAAHCAISAAPRSIHRLPSRICTWSTASRAPSPLESRRRCSCPERPLGTNIRGTRVSEILTDLFPLRDTGTLAFL